MVNNYCNVKFLFRCDVSPAIGLGHFRRCLTLAEKLKRRGASVFFACRSKDFDLSKGLSNIADDWVALEWSLTPESDVLEVIQIYRQRDIDIAVIDHYGADVPYQKALYEAGIRWLQFDGSAHQPLWADWVLNASPAAEQGTYLPLKQRDETRLLLGPAYALLRPEFLKWRPQVSFREKVRKILLTFGGGDDRGATVFFLEAIKYVDPAIERIVLVSSANPRLLEIVNWVDKNDYSNVTILVDEQEIAQHMAEADMAITAGGITTFETAIMGLPSLIVQLADNQATNAAAWEAKGAGVNLGRLDNLTTEFIRSRTETLILNAEMRRKMAYAGFSLVDGAGSERVAQILLNAISRD